MDLREFLSLVTPHEGVRFATLIQQRANKEQTKDYTHNEPYHTTEEGVEILEAADQIDRQNVYFSCASFEKASYIDAKGKRRSRTGENALAARAIWRDFDVGLNDDGKPKPNAYDSKMQVIHVVEEMCGTLGLPHPLLVSSGNGVHAYWAFNRDVPVNEWKRLAAMSVQVFNKFGVKSDSSRDTDISSVLRPPGGTNRGKYVGGREYLPVEYIRLGDAPCAPEDFVAILSPHATTQSTVASDVPSYMKLGEVSTLISHLIEYPPSYAELAKEKCAQIKHFSETGGDTYQSWWFGLGFCKISVEGEEKAHEWASKYDGYSYEETQFKLDEWSAGPPTCEKYGNEGDRCKACSFKGKIKSPIQLGLQETIPQQVIELEVEEGEERDDPPLPHNYTIREKKIQKLVVIDGVPNYLVASNTIFWFEDRYRATSGEIVFKVVTKVREKVVDSGKWEYHSFELPAAVVGKGGTELYGKLGEREIYPPQGKGAKTRMDDLVAAMAEELKQRKKEIQSYKHFGWQDNGGFLIGGERISSDGAHPVVVTGESAPSYLPAFKNNGGNAAEWSELVEQMYGHEGHEAFQTVTLFGIGSPLLRLYRNLDTGCLVNMVGDRGTGKTTAAKVALSAYGNPAGLMTELRSTTELALYHRMSAYHNVPCSIDELTNVDPAKASSMIYSIMNGQPRSGLTSGGKLRETMLSWQLVTFGAANESVVDLLATYKSDATAEISRLIELDWPSASSIQTIDRREMDALLNKMSDHYGAMGKEFVTWICQNERKAEKMLYKMREFIEDELNIDKENRFWSAHIAVPLTTKLILGKLGYLNAFSMDDIIGYCTSTIKEHKTNIDLLTLSGDETFHMMLTSMSDKIITTNTVKDLKHSTPDGVMVRGEPTGRAVMQDGDLFMSVAAIRAWCSEHRANYKKMRKELQASGVIKGDARYYIGRGTTCMTGQIFCWHLDLKKILGGNMSRIAADEGHLKLVS